MTFGEKLTGLRKREGLSQEALAEQLGVSRQAVSRWEQGAALPGRGETAALRPAVPVWTWSGCWMRNRMGRIGFRRRSSCRERKGLCSQRLALVYRRRHRHRRRVLWVW